MMVRSGRPVRLFSPTWTGRSRRILQGISTARARARLSRCTRIRGDSELRSTSPRRHRRAATSTMPPTRRRSLVKLHDALKRFSAERGTAVHGGARGFTRDVLETVVARNGGDAEHAALICVEINQCVGCTLGDDAAVLAPSSGEEPASPRHRAGVASMGWRERAVKF